MSSEILKAKNEISMVLGGRKTIAPIFSPFLTFGCGHPSEGRLANTHGPSSVLVKALLIQSIKLLHCFILSWQRT